MSISRVSRPDGRGESDEHTAGRPVVSPFSRSTVISDELWSHLALVFPADQVRPGRPWNDHRLTLEGIYWRFRTKSPWRNLPSEFGSWQSVWERHRRWSADGTYDRMFAVVRASTGGNVSGFGSLLSAEPQDSDSN